MSAQRLRDAAKVLRETAATMHPRVDLALADWLDDEADGDAYMPHQYPTPAPDGDVVAWACRACGATVSEYAHTPPAECSVDWRPAHAPALAVADAILGGQS